MKKFTTSAQKTLSLSKDAIIKKLREEVTKDTGLVFKDTRRKNILEAKLPDGSKLVIASFDKENGKTLAMIDHKDLPDNKVRSVIQKNSGSNLTKFLNQFDVLCVRLLFHVHSQAGFQQHSRVKCNRIQINIGLGKFDFINYYNCCLHRCLPA